MEDMKADYRSFRKQKAGDISSRVEFPFSSDRKRMSAVLNSAEGWTVYTKGASEIVLSLCTHILGPDGAAVELSPSKRSEIEASVIKKYADDGLRTICIAYRPLAHSPLPSADAESLERDLIMVAVTGIEDPVRSEVPKAIELCRKAGIDVRMVTGDNVNTARSIARACGIIGVNDDFLVMEGKEFNQRIKNENGEVSQEKFDQVWPRLRVLARSARAREGQPARHRQPRGRPWQCIRLPPSADLAHRGPSFRPTRGLSLTFSHV
jgi:magnesium-transporting ATPase (P-type)